MLKAIIRGSKLPILLYFAKSEPRWKSRDQTLCKFSSQRRLRMESAPNAKPCINGQTAISATLPRMTEVAVDGGVFERTNGGSEEGVEDMGEATERSKETQIDSDKGNDILYLLYFQVNYILR